MESAYSNIGAAPGSTLVPPERACQHADQAIVTRDDLEKLQKKGVDDVDYVLKKLWEAKMIVVLQDDSGNEYYGLQSDLKILKIFPQYNLNLLRTQSSNKTKSTNVLLENVDALKDQFRNIEKKALVIDLSEPTE